MFSKESKLLAKHWGTVEDIKIAENRLNEELSKFLTDVEGDLKKQDWWMDGWSFYQEDPDCIDISHDNWKVQDEVIIWIGIDGFKAHRLFGTESSPEMYIWVDSKFAKQLCAPLSEVISLSNVPLDGDLDQRSNGYIARKSLSTCLAEEVDDFSKLTLDALLMFFGNCAAYETQFTEVVKKLISSTKE
jgi:hypothetical protein